jgi:transcriptional regulator with XRE-family HTH domain
MSFSEQLKSARLRAGYTQQQVADLIGITNSTYCGYETGKRQPDVFKIKQLSRILNTSGDVLLETGFEAASFALAPAEIAFLEKYRALTPESQSRVDNCLSFEYKQLGDEVKEVDSISTKIG